VLRVEVILGVAASAIAILTFMARAYANIRKGRRIKRYSQGIDRRSEEELARMREELRAAQEMSERKRARRED
jgi:plasmid replication initiation protein